MNEVKTYRLNQLTRELGVTFAELQELLKTNGIKVNTPNDRVTEEAFQIIKEYYNLDIDKDTNIKKDKDTSIEEDQNTKIEEVKKITEKEIKTDLKTEPLQQDTKSFEFNIKVKGKIDLDEEVDKATKEKPSTTSKQKIKEDKIQPKEQQHTIADTKQKEQATEELITKKYTKEELSETESKTKIASEAIKHTPVNEEEPSIIDKKVEKPYLQEINLKVKYKIDLDEVEPKREKSKQNGKNQA
ncbi:MAG: translation initiation factor IF-2 N-terminal domain-containing protein, partial [Bacteroidales bacterium]